MIVFTKQLSWVGDEMGGKIPSAAKAALSLDAYGGTEVPPFQNESRAEYAVRQPAGSTSLKGAKGMFHLCYDAPALASRVSPAVKLGIVVR